ncbi:AEC family transporter [Faecalibacterium hattorii]|uniref:AEC family transporter n=1 Tax=Faecalibacterium hattorii TaxID=2935520 RepID=UPI003AAA463F
MAFGVLAGRITAIFLEVLLGYVGARSGIIKDRDSKFLSDFIMKLLLPCTMLAGAAVDGEPELLTQAGVLFVLLLALFAVVTTGLCRLSSWLHHDTPGESAVFVRTRYAQLRLHRPAAVQRPAGHRARHRVRHGHGLL